MSIFIIILQGFKIQSMGIFFCSTSQNIIESIIFLAVSLEYLKVSGCEVGLLGFEPRTNWLRASAKLSAALPT
jgi:hypothetical protein